MRELATESDSSPDEGVPGKRSGYCGVGEPMTVGVTLRARCVTGSRWRHREGGRQGLVGTRRTVHGLLQQ